VASAPFASTIIAVHAQYFNLDGGEKRVDVIIRHPVTEAVLHGTFIAQLAGSRFGPTSQGSLLEIVEKAIIPALFTLPEDEKGHVTAGRPFVGDAKNRLDCQL
jgi:hypothetical protein